jgi:F-type H+-transporting ATPase subunit epsilon
MSGYKLNLFTPKGVVVKELVCSDVTVPTIRGEINILENHTHILTELGTGILTAKVANGVRHLSITAGLCRVMGETITLLSFTSEKPEDIDQERARAAKAKATSRLSGEGTLSDVELIKFRRKLERAEMRLKLAMLK